MIIDEESLVIVENAENAVNAWETVNDVRFKRKYEYRNISPRN